KQQRLFLALLDERSGEVDAAVHGVAGGLQLLLPVALLRRLRLAEEVAEVEEPVDAGQQHFQLEEDLLAAAHLEAADPPFALRQVDGADSLRVAHQLEEEVLREGALFRGCGHPRSEPCKPAGAFLPRCSNARWVATRPRGVRARYPSIKRYGSYTASTVPDRSPAAVAKMSRPTGPPPNLSISETRIFRSIASRPAASTSSRCSARSATGRVTPPSPSTSAKSRTRRSSRLAIRGV